MKNIFAGTNWVVPKGEKKRKKVEERPRCYLVAQNQAFLFLEYADRCELYYRSPQGPVWVRTDRKLQPPPTET